MGTIATLTDQKVDQLMSVTQQAVQALNNFSWTRKQVVASVDVEFEEEIFVLAEDMGISQDGDRYWFETLKNRWHFYDACNIPRDVARRFTTVLTREYC